MKTFWCIAVEKTELLHEIEAESLEDAKVIAKEEAEEGLFMHINDSEIKVTTVFEKEEA